ncbi:pentatricopeptide repeat-containing protein At2g36730 [Magnolia sinica]|uniref:pentatricopeptide repeat-containing protein At2g36730 n=1 Tax=Magnolia sinica TaxID=86752 RepID=UPI00265A1E52|nr:pentatricopeptide repeat-containing protein At2g36730 [Magnolia sinica]
MSRLQSSTAYLHYPPKNPNGILNFVSIKQQCLYLLNLCSSMKELHQIQAQIQTSGLHRDGFLVSEVLRFCALSPSGSLDYARSLLDAALDPIPASWNFVIRGYAGNDCPKEAVEVFVEMRRRGMTRNKLTFPFLFKACARLFDLEGGRQVQAEIVKNGVDSDVYVQNTLIHFYGSCGRICDARRVFDGMCFRTVVSWNTIISGYVENSQSDESLAVFTLMRSCGFEPDGTTMVVLLSACAELGNLSLGKWVHHHVIEKGMVMNLQLGTALVNMYAKCGAIDYARCIFYKMRERNVWTWSAMILGLAQHGQAKEALELFQLLTHEPIKPNYVTYLGVLCACSHAGLVDDGYRFFRDMSCVRGIQPMMSHYSAMVDILGRRGRVAEAYKFITSMPVEPDAVVWRTLLSACSIHDVTDSSGIGKKVRNRLLELEPKRSGNYVMVANMYAEVGLWEEVANVRRVMRHERLKKMAGESCIEVVGSVHRFVCRDDSCNDFESIYRLMEGLNLQMKTAGLSLPSAAD